MFHGLLVVDKPLGLTSCDAVNRAKGWFPKGTRIGHAGTLDPLATGVLVLTIGKATRLTEYVQAMDKVYRAWIRLGIRSSTDDGEGELTTLADVVQPSRDAVAHVLTDFVGEIEQVPPAFSAAKVSGRRAYELARKGRDVVLAPRRIMIHNIHLETYAYPDLEIEVQCAKGTYVRSLARDVGERLGTGGMLNALRRTRIGPFDQANAVAISADTATARTQLRPLADAVAQLPRLVAPDTDLDRLRSGQFVALHNRPWTEPPPGREAAIFDSQGAFFGVARVDWEKAVLAPHKTLMASTD